MHTYIQITLTDFEHLIPQPLLHKGNYDVTYCVIYEIITLGVVVGIKIIRTSGNSNSMSWGTRTEISPYNRIIVIGCDYISHPGIPGVTLCFCTGSYAAAAAAAAADDDDFCPHDNFWTTFWISLIFGTIVDPDP